MFRKLINKLSTKCHLSINTLCMALFMSMVCSVCAINTAGAVTWTAGEILQAMQQAQANGQGFDKLLAEKVRDDLAKAGFQVIDNTLTYSTVIPAKRIVFYQDGIPNSEKEFKDYLTALAFVGPYLGTCSLPIPDGSLIAARSDSGNVTAKFSNSGTYFNLQTTPSQVILSLNVAANITAQTKFGLEWCGTVAWPPTSFTCATPLVRNPACPPAVCLVPKFCWYGPCGCSKWSICPLPNVCPLPIPVPNIVEEKWIDWAPAAVDGPIEASVKLVLDHSFTVTNNAITVGAHATINPATASALPYAALGAVIPDTRLIKVPGALVPHLVTAPILQSLSDIGNSLLLWTKASGYDYEFVNNSLLPDLVKKQQARLDEKFNLYFPLTLQFQDFNNLDPASQALLKLVLDYLVSKINIVGEFALDAIKNNWTEVLYYVLTDNRAALEQLFTNQALCAGVEKLKANMPATSLYSTASGMCAAIDPRTPGAGPFYATADCQTKIGFQAENFNDFCSELFASRPNPLLGNPAAWPITHIETDALSTLPYASSKWSLSSAAQLAAGVEPIKDNHIPFMKRIQYRKAGECALEMRVYKKNISDKNLTPLLMIHGGSWTYRSAGFLGMESMISNYTEDNFVVFAPFYRLIGDKDGNQECRNATWENTVADVEAALDWVRANGATFGASDTTKIAVTGQSAGAHLAGWLMTHRPTQVSSGLLFYPPTDVIDFLTRLQGVGGATFPPLSDSAGTPYDPSSAQEIIETYLQLPLGSARTVGLTNPPSYLRENSFAQKIGLKQSAYPPAFILQGTRDSLLTYSQSQVLCESYGGVVNVDWSSTPDLRAIYPCGDRSQLHLFKEADHAFEVCPFTDITSACRAGSAASALLLIDSLQKGRQWLSTHNLPISQIVAGADHTVALKSNGTLWGWGGNWSGQLGDGTTVNKIAPVQIGIGSTWVSVAAGTYHNMALKSDGTLWTWGANWSGQLGDGTTVDKSAPIKIGAGNTWVLVAAGLNHTVALKSDGTLWAWGSNTYGQLGDGTTVNKSAPVQIGAGSTWVTVAAGWTHNVALKSDGTLWAWGDNNYYGPLGDGTTVSKSAPVQIGTGSTWVSVTAGYAYTVALKSDGTLWAWGDNRFGQLGDGTTDSKSAPVQIGTGSFWVSVDTGGSHTVALKSDGTLWALGYNDYGQLGDGTTVSKSAPVQIGTGSFWVSVAAGQYFTVALKSDGTLWAWGYNFFGQLGDGTAINKNTPTQVSMP